MTLKNPRQSKICLACGRSFEWRKKWAKNWNEVKWCSDACRAKRPKLGLELESTILALLASRSFDSSICPSEVARSLQSETWRDLMEPVRQAARRLVAQGRIDITQGGQVVDATLAKGAIRLRLRRRVPSDET
jgi:hypothetical protein